MIRLRAGDRPRGGEAPAEPRSRTAAGFAVAVCLLAGAPAIGNAPGSSAAAPTAERRATTRPADATVQPENDLGQSPIRRGAGARTPGASSAAAATTRPAPAKGAGVSYGFELPRVLMALGLVIGLIFLLRWVMKGLFAGGVPGAAAGSRAMQVLSRSPLSPRQQLLLVRVGRRLIVVGDSAGQMTALSEITDADEVAALVGQVQGEKTTAASRSFGGLLSRVRQGFNGAAGQDDGPEPPKSIAVVGADDRTGPSLVHYRDPRDEEEEGEDASLAGARGEIRDLVAKVRLVTHQFKET